MGEWVMHYARIKKDGNGVSEHLIVEADDILEAKIKISVFCDIMNKKYPDEKYLPRFNGYKLTVGGGCKW